MLNFLTLGNLTTTFHIRSFHRKLGIYGLFTTESIYLDIKDHLDNHFELELLTANCKNTQEEHVSIKVAKYSNCEVQ